MLNYPSPLVGEGAARLRSGRVAAEGGGGLYSITEPYGAFGCCCTEISAMLKTSVWFGGMTPPAPDAP